jgi:hypothetical protein
VDTTAQLGRQHRQQHHRGASAVRRRMQRRHRMFEPCPVSVARKELGWPKICELAHAFLWGYSYQ